MIKKTITYPDLDGNDVTEDFYFHLSKAEIIKFYVGGSEGDDYYTHLKTIIEKENTGELIEAFDHFITTSVGRRSEDNRRFVKNQEITKEFMQSEAYSVMFMEMVEDVNKATEFFNSVFPADLVAEVEKMDLQKDENGKLIWPDADELKDSRDNAPEVVSTEKPAEEKQPAYQRENRDPTSEELASMTPDELKAAFAWRTRKK